MNHNRKNVFTVTLNPNLGETPELLMTAIAMAIFDQAWSKPLPVDRGHVGEG